MNVLEESGPLMLGTRLKRLGDRFLAEVSKVYKEQRIEFEPAWFPVFFALDQHGPQSLTELAVRLEVSHSAISQMVSQLQNRGLLETAVSLSDARVKQICFTEKGLVLLEQIRRVWRALTDTLGQILPDEANQLFLRHLAAFEERIGTGFLSEKTLSTLEASPQEVVCKQVSNVEKLRLLEWSKQQPVAECLPEWEYILADCGGETLGFVAFDDSDRPVLLHRLYVLQETRRQGIATRLLETLNGGLQVPPLDYFLVKEPTLDLLAFLIKTPFSFKVNGL